MNKANKLVVGVGFSHLRTALACFNNTDIDGLSFTEEENLAKAKTLVNRIINIQKDGIDSKHKLSGNRKTLIEARK